MDGAGAIDATVSSPNDSSSDGSDKEEETFATDFRFPSNSRFVCCYDKIQLDGRVPRPLPKFSNSLLAGVGFLELANAGDFAANIWNDTPIPKFAVALMALGGILALTISCFAAKDAILSRRNLQILRHEGHCLRAELDRRAKAELDARDVEARLDVLRREIGTEAISRFGMDAFMGGGAVLISVGTFLAIGGANHAVWLASNYLSGYVGNAPLALYSLCNFFWMAHLFFIARHHGRAGRRLLPRGGEAVSVLTQRVRRVQLFAAISGFTNLLGGVGSLCTATHWWGYVMLAPVIISSILLNTFWRRFVGYTRGFCSPMLMTDADKIISEISYIISVQQQIKASNLDPSICDTSSLPSTLSFIVSNDIFEQFCTILAAKCPSIVQSLQDPTSELTHDMLLDASFASVPQILEAAQATIRKEGPQCLQYRLDYLADLLGSYISKPSYKHQGSATEKESSAV